MAFTSPGGTVGTWIKPPLEELQAVTDDVLLGELVRRNIIEPGIALALGNNEALVPESEADTDGLAIYGGPVEEVYPFQIDYTELEEARADLFIGRRAEGLIHLERALGGDFVGRIVQS